VNNIESEGNRQMQSQHRHQLMSSGKDMNQVRLRASEKDHAVIYAQDKLMSSAELFAKKCGLFVGKQHILTICIRLMVALRIWLVFQLGYVLHNCCYTFTVRVTECSATEQCTSIYGYKNFILLHDKQNIHIL
jgi:hypothetical protein